MNEKYLLRLQEDLRLKNFTQNTCDDYYRFTKRFLEFTGKEAMSITYADIRRFIFHMKDNESKKASTINVYTAAIRFFFEYTLGYVWDPKKIPKMKCDRQLPVILTREQVGLLIDSMDNYKHKVITSTMYSSGLRVSEVCRLRYEDVRRSQRMIHVPLSKNRQDRYTILSDRNLEILTEYWYRYNRPRGWLFPSTVRDVVLCQEKVQVKRGLFVESMESYSTVFCDHVFQIIQFGYHLFTEFLNPIHDVFQQITQFCSLPNQCLHVFRLHPALPPFILSIPPLSPASHSNS